MNDTAFAARELSVGYRGKALISGIDISLGRGQILALIGPNGAGKSTILKTITGQLPPIAGEISICGKALDAWPRNELAKKLAVVLTERVRPEMMTCFEVAAMGRYPYTGRFGMLTDDDRACVREALSSVCADDIADRDFARVSDGQRQRVLLARALCQRPEVLVLDEPTSYLDIRHKIDVLGILASQARERRLTVILSLHEIDLAEKLADRILCVSGRRATPAGTPREVFTEARIAGLYDIARGSYLVRRGSVELEKTPGPPRVFVVGGAGYGLEHYRALQKRRIPFAAGVLFENDMEYDVARALAAEVVGAPAFEPVSSEIEGRARALITACEAVLDAGAPSGRFNSVNAGLLGLAGAQGIPVVHSVEELPET